ncbi:MAG: orotidine-5'-phosphate decarboxylase [Actinomycetota bacterium]|nr:orotidine-5'-phosphate decarboxylase [Actinomycetota bacterium]
MKGGRGDPHDNPVLVALDMGTAEAAVRMAKALLPYVGGFKVGLELLMGPGPAAVAAVGALGKPVLADAKLHDIPTTAGRAARRLAALGARWVTAHALGGRSMLESVRQELEEEAGGRPAGVLAVTVLTSLGDSELAEAGLGTTGKLTSRLARLALAAGCEGVICSPRELLVVGQVAPRLRKVTPGIRIEGSPLDDQVRVASAEDALRHGADLVVVGRAVTRAADPVEAAARLAQQVQV